MIIALRILFCRVVTMRYLTESEIEYILDFIQPNNAVPSDISKNIYNKQKQQFVEQLQTIKVYPEIIPELKKNIQKQHIESLIHPGECVGIITAQSIGERQTQMSVAYAERLVVSINGKISALPIGEFVDHMMSIPATTVAICSTDPSSWVCDITHQRVKVLTVTQKQKMEWAVVNEVSRHRPRGNLVRITTETGREVTTTLSHSHLEYRNGQVLPVVAGDLRIGDRIPVFRKYKIDACLKISRTAHAVWYALTLFRPVFVDAVGNLSFKCKRSTYKVIRKYMATNNIHNIYINGSVLIVDNGSTNKALAHLNSNTPSIPSFIVNGSDACRRAFVNACFQGEVVMRTTRVNHILRNQLVMMLASFGVLATHTPKTIEISGSENIRIFKRSIGPLNNAPMLTTTGFQRRYNMSGFVSDNIKRDIRVTCIDSLPSVPKKTVAECEAADVVWDRIVDIEIVYEKEYGALFVYDLSVKGNESFALESGVVVHNTLNTFHQSGISCNMVVTGVPRFTEILSATKDPKTSSCSVTFKNASSIQDIRRDLEKCPLQQISLEYLTSKPLVVRPYKEETWFPAFAIVRGHQPYWI